MVKAYLRYEPENTFGVVASGKCNVESYESNFAITGCNEHIVIWNIRLQEKVKTLTPENSTTTAQSSKSYVSRLAKQPQDGTLLAAGYGNGTIRVWDLKESTVKNTFTGHKSAITCIAWREHMVARTQFASGGADTDIVVWDTVAESGIVRLRGHRDQVTDLTFMKKSESTVVSCSKDKTCKVWNIENQVCLQTIVERDELWSCAFNDIGTRLFIGSTDHLLRIYSCHVMDDEPLELMGTLQRHNEALTGIEVNGDIVLMHSRDKVLEIIQINSEEEAIRRKKRRKKRTNEKKKKQKKENIEEEDMEEMMIEDKPGSIKRAESADEFEEFKATDEFKLLPIIRAKGKIMSATWDSQGKRAILGLSTNAVEIIPVKIEEEIINTNGITLIDRPGHRHPVRAVAVSSEDSMILSTSKDSVKIWSAHSGNCIRTMASGYGLCGMFLPGNQHCVIGTNDGQIQLFDLGQSEKVFESKSHAGAIYGIVNVPNHTGFLTCSADRTVRFFKITAAGSKLGFKEDEEKIIELTEDALAVQYSPNHKWIAVALLDATVHLYFADTLKFDKSFYGHKLPVVTCSFSSDSTMLATGSADKSIKLWSTTFGNCHKSILAHEDSVMQVAFMPETHYLVSASRDGAVKVWDCDAYELISTWGHHLGEVWGLAFAYDASYVVTSGSDRAIRIWRRTKDQLFLDEERDKEMEEEFEQEAVRDDKGVNDFVSVRPTRRTIESVRTTERLMEVIDETEKDDLLINISTSPVGHVLRCLHSISAAHLFEVVLALPFPYALKLLEFVVQLLEKGQNGEKFKDELLLCELETASRAALICIHIHHKQLANHTELLLKLRDYLRGMAIVQRDYCGVNIAAMYQIDAERKMNKQMFDDLDNQNPAKRPKLGDLY